MFFNFGEIMSKNSVKCRLVRYPLLKNENDEPSFSPKIHPLLQNIYQARGVTHEKYIDYALKNLLPFKDLKGIDETINILYSALLQQQKILIVGDFDVDGATSTALMMRLFKAFGYKNVDYLIPNRFTFGYGLTQEIVQHIGTKLANKPDIIITVDNGIANYEGVVLAHNYGIKVIITDHHLPSSDNLPPAEAIVNPNQLDDNFSSKNLAGVGVAFYVMTALRAYLRQTQWFSKNNIAEPNLAQYLDLVALGTLADLALLDYNNRILVYNGLERIKQGNCCLALKVLLRFSNRDYEKVKSDDLVFTVAPRLNASGRLEDMSLGVACLLSDDAIQVRKFAGELDELNKERRSIETNMHQEALEILNKYEDLYVKTPVALCVFEENWHQGVIGIVASKLKERFHRPVVAFAQVSNDEIKGSLRSIAGVHIRDILEKIATQNPGLLIKYGGHAMAAGISVRKNDYAKFKEAFTTTIQNHTNEEILEHCIYTDGELEDNYINLDIAELVNSAGPWGNGFPEPLFSGNFKIVSQRWLNGKHLKFVLTTFNRQQNDAQNNSSIPREFNAIFFNVDYEQWTALNLKYAHFVYRLDINEYNGIKKLQLLIERFF